MGVMRTIPNMAMGGIVFLIWLGLIAASVYALILLIMLMRRAIRLLDIHIAKNSKKNTEYHNGENE